MKKSLVFIVVLFVGIARPAHADVITNYTINFTAGLGVDATSGSFTHDSTTLYVQQLPECLGTASHST